MLVLKIYVNKDDLPFVPKSRNNFAEVTQQVTFNLVKSDLHVLSFSLYQQPFQSFPFQR